MAGAGTRTRGATTSTAGLGRPSRNEVDPAALRLIERYGPSIMGSARRYSLTRGDAEDAYQRALEILLTKAPTTREAELLPWLRTVVKHEAFALRRQRERHGVPDDELVAAYAGTAPATDEQAERLERLQVGAEALARLKPQEVRCLLLLAEGYSYKQIQEETGWTYTKVNRCLAEGRRSFVQRVASIESGAECERLEPLLSALADGQAGAEDLQRLRPHLRSCLACRATLRDYRSAPAQVAALVPPAALAAEETHRTGPGVFDWAMGWWQERAAALSFKVHAAVEMLSAQKATAVAASTAALAGGGVATVQTLDVPDRPPARERTERATKPRPKAEPGREVARVAPARRSKPRAVARPARRRRAVATSSAQAVRTISAPAPAPAPTPAPRAVATAPTQSSTAAPAPAQPEFARAASAPEPTASPNPTTTGSSSRGGSGESEFGGGGGGGAGGGEFGL